MESSLFQAKSLEIKDAAIKIEAHASVRKEAHTVGA
jgi:hypothetical protein